MIQTKERPILVAFIITVVALLASLLIFDYTAEASYEDDYWFEDDELYSHCYWMPSDNPAWNTVCLEDRSFVGFNRKVLSDGSYALFHMEFLGSAATSETMEFEVQRQRQIKRDTFDRTNNRILNQHKKNKIKKLQALIDELKG